MIIHSSSVSPVPTHQYLQRTLQYVLYLYCFMLVMQLPLILLEVPVNLTKVTVWLLYLLALSALLKRRNNLAQPRIKSGLFLLYFSYLVIAIKLWPAVTNTHYFLLLSMTSTSFDSQVFFIVVDWCRFPCAFFSFSLFCLAISMHFQTLNKSIAILGHKQ